MPASHVGGFWGGARPPGAPQQIMPQALPKAADVGKVKSGVTPVAVAQLAVPIVQRPSVFAGHTSFGTSSRTVWLLPSQLNAVRRLCATWPCPLNSIRISTYCAVVSPPTPDMISSMLAKWKTACPGPGTSTASSATNTTAIRDMTILPRGTEHALGPACQSRTSRGAEVCYGHPAMSLPPEVATALRS